MDPWVGLSQSGLEGGLVMAQSQVERGDFWKIWEGGCGATLEGLDKGQDGSRMIHGVAGCVEEG